MLGVVLKSQRWLVRGDAGSCFLVGGTNIFEVTAGISVVGGNCEDVGVVVGRICCTATEELQGMSLAAYMEVSEESEVVVVDKEVETIAPNDISLTAEQESDIDEEEGRDSVAGVLPVVDGYRVRRGALPRDDVGCSLPEYCGSAACASI